MEIIEIQRLGREFLECENIAGKLFREHKADLDAKIGGKIAQLDASGEWGRFMDAAQKDLEKWSAGGKIQAYVPRSLALARVSREVANNYEKENALELMNLNAIHQTILAHSFSQNEFLLNKLIQEGKDGRKLGLVEMADRLGPVLQPF